MLNRRLGRFHLPMYCIKEQPLETVKVFKKLGLVPVRAECLYAENGIDYVAISSFFSEVPEGAMVPEYELLLRYNDDNELEEIEVIKKEDAVL